MASTTRPKVRATPTWVTAPRLTSLTTTAPVPANTRANVPRPSAATRFMTEDLRHDGGISTGAVVRQARQCPRASSGPTHRGPWGPGRPDQADVVERARTRRRARLVDEEARGQGRVGDDGLLLNTAPAAPR